MAKLNIEKCINIIKGFLLKNRMKLNDGKTDFLLMGTANKLKKLIFDDITIAYLENDKNLE